MKDQPEKIIDSNILKCSIDKSITQIYLSLMDYKNNYFISKDQEKIIQFYKSFADRDDLIEWMKERPKGSCEIREVEGEEDIIVVIPTTDFDGKYAKTCREEIFKGMHIIFVVSGKGNHYFNYAHNCNVGIKKSLEYNPKWIIISNDDMYKVDDPEKLIQELSELPNDVDVVYTISPEGRFSIECQVVRFTRFYSIYELFRSKGRYYNVFYRKFNIKYGTVRKYIGPSIINLIIKFMLAKPVKSIGEYIENTSFGIFSYRYIKKRGGELFDETFINTKEDTDVSLFNSIHKARGIKINYKIGDLLSRTLGRGKDRYLREIAGSAYFCYKYRDMLK